MPVVSIIPIDNGWNVEFEIIAKEVHEKSGGKTLLNDMKRK